MSRTGFNDISLTSANTAAAGRGNLTAQLALVKADLDALTALVNDLKAKFNAHKHRGDGAQAGQYTTSTPVSDAATVAGGAALTVAVADVTITSK